MIEDITVVIAIGGEGSRLKKVSGEVPKPLFPICGISTLERALNELDKYGFKKVILSTCFRKELFKDFIKNNTFNFHKLLIFGKSSMNRYQNIIVYPIFHYFD